MPYVHQSQSKVPRIRVFVTLFFETSLYILNCTLEKYQNMQWSPVLWFAGNPARFYSQYTSRAQRVWLQILDRVLKVGQIQLLRKHIAYELNTSCKFDSKHLASALQVMNKYAQTFVIWSS